MGVPRLFPYIVKHFGREALKHFREGEYSIAVDNFYFDANALLHATCQDIFNYGPNKKVVDDFACLSYEEKRLRCFKVYFEDIKFLTSIVVPQKVIYIANDGPAPLAKQAQQRQRRFASAFERNMIKSTDFDSNQLTPGTLFMFELTKFMHTEIRKELNNPLSPWFGLKVYFSSTTVPGEGEHKCLDHIRANKNANEESHCIFGPDGDLIMLTLSAHVPKIYLFREDQYNKGFYDILDMGIVRRRLVDIMQQSPGVSSRKRTLNDVSNDFIIAGFFVGNDFLPKIQMFMYLEDGLELMIRTYANISYGGTKCVLSKNGIIDHQGFTRFVQELARREHNYILDQATPKPDKQGKFLDQKFDNLTLLKHVEENGTSSGALDMTGFRKDYYAKAGVDANDEEQVKKICIDYLRAIAWVFEYYIDSLPNWRDFYAWHYAPLMVDLARVMNEISSNEEIYSIYKFKMDVPPRPFVQLLSVLPPASATLLPEPFRVLLTSKKSPLVKLGYYPPSFEVDLEGKTKEHMGVVLLPFVNIDEIEKAYLPISKSLKPRILNGEKKEAYARNDVTKPELFYHDKNHLVSYTSEYGDIARCSVRKEYIN